MSSFSSNTSTGGYSSSSSSSVVVKLAIVTTASSFITAVALYSWHRRQVQGVSEQWEQKRQEERTGRIRAEQKLRKALLKEEATSASVSSGNNNDGTADNNDGTDTNNNSNVDEHAMKLSTIGTIVSPYTKRMGTPRQGALVPSSRGYIQFASTLSPEAVDGIQDYSHLWVIFRFHQNTNLATSKKTKVRPPRGGGIKVGQLSTRSPHRPNDLGLSLVAIEKWDPSTRRLHISALDLVNGTPVYDVKPYVLWDVPGGGMDLDKVKVPTWVENRNDVLPKVEFQENADADLLKHVKANRLAPLYSKKDLVSNFQAAKQTLIEILAQDPRSSHKGVTTNQRGSLSGTEPYKILFAFVEVEFVVNENGAYVIAIHPAPQEEQGEELKNKDQTE